MSLPRSLTLTMTPRGKVLITMEGFQGEVCLTLLGPILKSLGTPATLQPTLDFFLPPPPPLTNSTPLTQE